MSAIHWFKIPVSDFDRALNFYQTVMAAQLYVNDQRETVGSMLGVFPHESGLGGCLVHNPQYGYSPADDMNDVIARVGDAGGAVLLQKTALGEDTGGGYVAWVRDTEGNKVRFYSTE